MSVKCDKSGFKKLYKKLQEIEILGVEAGYYSEDIHPTAEIPMSNLAGIHEYGWGVPERKFMTNAHYINMSSDLSRKVGSWIYSGNQQYSEILSDIGKTLEINIAIAIEDGTYAELSKKTIELKGDDTPLIETSYMKDNAKSKVVKKGE